MNPRQILEPNPVGVADALNPVAHAIVVRAYVAGNHPVICPLAVTDQDLMIGKIDILSPQAHTPSNACRNHGAEQPSGTEGPGEFGQWMTAYNVAGLDAVSMSPQNVIEKKLEIVPLWCATVSFAHACGEEREMGRNKDYNYDQ